MRKLIIIQTMLLILQEINYVTNQTKITINLLRIREEIQEGLIKTMETLRELIKILLNKLKLIKKSERLLKFSQTQTLIQFKTKKILLS